MRIKLTYYPVGYEVTPGGSVLHEAYWEAKAWTLPLRLSSQWGAGHTKQEAIQSLLRKLAPKKRVKKVVEWIDV